MSITVDEKFESPENWTQGENAGGSIIYVIKGSVAVSRDEALAALLAESAASVVTGNYTVYRKSRSVEVINDKIWIGTVRYSQAQAKEIGDSDYQFDIGTSTLHVQSSIATVNRYGGTTNFKQFINVTATKKENSEEYDYDVSGLDMTVPVYTFSETHYKSNSSISSAYKSTLMNLTGRINSGAFKGFAEGEVMFLGASGAKRKDESWEITYRFAASPNKTDIIVGDVSGIAKKGWEYLWALQGTDDEGFPKVIQVNIEQIYEYGDFDGLGL